MEKCNVQWHVNHSAQVIESEGLYKKPKEVHLKNNQAFATVILAGPQNYIPIQRIAITFERRVSHFIFIQSRTVGLIHLAPDLSSNLESIPK